MEDGVKKGAKDLYLRRKATGGLEQKRRMSSTNVHFNRSMLVLESNGRSRETS